MINRNSIVERDFIVKGDNVPHRLAELYILERYDEAMYTTDTWCFTSQAEAEAFADAYRKEHVPTSQYEEYDLCIYRVPLSSFRRVV